MSDVRKLEDLQNLMQVIMKFLPARDDKGDRLHYHDWVLADLENENEDV